MRLLRFLQQLNKHSLGIRQVRGLSMMPAYQPGRLVVGIRTRRLRVGDVVIIRHEGREKMKRISQIRADAIYVLGDNAPLSTDSRTFGWLPLEQAIYRVIRLKS